MLNYKDYINSEKNFDGYQIDKIFDETTIEGIQEYYDYLTPYFRREKPITPEDEELDSVEIICKLTSACNQRCAYCFDKNNNMNPVTTTLTKEQIMLFFEKLCRTNHLIAWTWHGGECFLADRNWFDDVCLSMEQLAYKMNCEVKFYAQTNGTLLNEEWFKIIDKYDIKIGVSYDWTSQFVRGYELDKNTLNKTPGSICVINKYNIKDLIKIYQKSIKEDVGISFNFVFPDKNHSLEEYINTQEAIYEYKKYLDYFLFNPAATKTERSAEAYVIRALGKSSLVCNLSNCFTQNRIGLNSDGTLWMCDDTNYLDMYICTIQDFTSSQEFKQHPRYKRLALMKDAQYASCGNCLFDKVCGRGCFHCSYTESNATKPYSFNCDFVKAIYPYIYQKIGNLTPNEFMKISPILKTILIKNFYYPAYLKEVNLYD